MFVIRQLIALAMLASISSVSFASVTYSFNGFFGANLPSDWQDATAIFSLTVPDVITSNVTIPLEGMASCSTPYSTCISAKFDMSAEQAGLSDIPNVQALELSSTSGTILYYFDQGSFSTLGPHISIPNFSAGTLTVQSTVPEPGTFTCTLLGVVALALRWSKRRVVA